MTAKYVDFEGNELRLGDEVIACDLERHGFQLRRGEVIKLCPSAVKIRVKRVSRVHGPEGEHDILRGPSWIMLIAHHPSREAELNGSKAAIIDL